MNSPPTTPHQFASSAYQPRRYGGKRRRFEAAAIAPGVKSTTIGSATSMRGEKRSTEQRTIEIYNDELDIYNDDCDDFYDGLPDLGSFSDEETDAALFEPDLLNELDALYEIALLDEQSAALQSKMRGEKQSTEESAIENCNDELDDDHALGQELDLYADEEEAGATLFGRVFYPMEDDPGDWLLFAEMDAVEEMALLDEQSAALQSGMRDEKRSTVQGTIENCIDELDDDHALVQELDLIVDEGVGATLFGRVFHPIEDDAADDWMLSDELEAVDEMALFDEQSAGLQAQRYPRYLFGAPDIAPPHESRQQHVDANCNGALAVAVGSHVWLFREGKPFRHLFSNDNSDGCNSYITCVSWCPEHQFILAIGRSDGSVVIYNCKHERLLHHFMAHPGHSLCRIAWRNVFCFSTGGTDGRIVHFDVSLADPTSILPSFVHDESSPICCLQWNPEGTVLASGGTDHSLLLWDAAAGLCNPVAGFAFSDAVRAVSWSRWHRGLLAVAAESQIHFADAETLSFLGSIDDTGSTITALAWSDHDCVVSSHISSKVSSWSHSSLSLMNEYVGHSAGVLHMGVSLSTSAIYSVGSDEIINLWDLE